MVDLKRGFSFRPLSNLRAIQRPTTRRMGAAAEPDPLGPLAQLPGRWEGTGFNTIWRPLHDPAHPGQGHFLELNLTVEILEFDRIGGQIPNRGLLQPDLIMFGLHYLQQVSDNFGNGLHIEPGVWLNVPATTNPQVPPTVVRMGSIPHGTTIVAQGLASSEARAPKFEDTNIKPFVIGDPAQTFDFPEADLSIATPFRSSPELIAGITQAMVDSPNSVLQTAIDGQEIVNTINLVITTEPTPVIGGGTANTAFLIGGPDGPNADAVSATSIFWIEQVREADGTEFLQLQYTQTVLLDFGGLSWPHLSVATLRQSAKTRSDRERDQVAADNQRG
ncbi:MAG TPA: heme-binding protein [Allosphingosinicella sp.]